MLVGMYFNNDKVMRVSRNKVPYVSKATKAKVIYDPAAEAFFARLEVQPTSARKRLYSTVFSSLRAAGILESLDALYLLAAADASTACTNLVQNVYNLTALYEPIFTPDRGFAGNENGAYLNTGLNLGVSQGLKYEQSSAHLSIYNRTERNPGSAVQMGCQNMTTFCTIAVNHAGTRCYGQVNDGNDGAKDPTSVGFFVADRVAADSRAMYINGEKVGGDIAAPSRPLPELPLYILARNNKGWAGNFSKDELAAATVGGGLGQRKVAQLNTIVQAYLTAVGANV